MASLFQRISWKRSLSDYSKVQALVSRIARGNRLQLALSKPSAGGYLNVGCGPFMQSDFVNVDYDWRPGIDLCWNVSRGLPYTDASFRGIFSEHCLEHVSLAEARGVLRELRRLLAAGGTLRLVLPDAALYLRIYEARKRGEKTPFPYETPDEHSAWTPLMHVNQMFRGYGHAYAYDEETITMLLREAGFSDIRAASYRQGRDPKLLIDQQWRSRESLFVEASP